MLGKKRVLNSSFKVFANSWVNGLLHISLLFLFASFVSICFSLLIKNIGYSSFYNDIFNANESHYYQRQLFKLSQKNGLNERVVIVGNPNFIGEVQAKNNLTSCSGKIEYLSIPNYSMNDIKYISKRKGGVIFNGLDFKDVIFENNISIWSELSTEPQGNSLSLWNSAKSNTVKLFDRRDIKLFFSFIKDSVFSLTINNYGKLKKKYSRGDQIYSFNPDKFKELLDENENLKINFILNEKLDSFMKLGEDLKFFDFLKEQTQSINLYNTNADLDFGLGC